MHDLRFQSDGARLVDHLLEPRSLDVDDGVIGLVGAREVREDAAQPDVAGPLRCDDRLEQPRPVVRVHAVAVEPGVHLDRQHRRRSGTARAVHHGGEVPTGGHRQVHPRCDRGREVGVVGVQPRQDRRGDARGAQAQRLGECAHAQFAHPLRQHRAGHLRAAVPVAVGLDDGHDRGVPGAFADHTDVVGEGVVVDGRERLRPRRPGLGWAGLGLAGHDHGFCHWRGAPAPPRRRCRHLPGRRRAVAPHCSLQTAGLSQCTDVRSSTVHTSRVPDTNFTAATHAANERQSGADCTASRVESTGPSSGLSVL